MKALFMASLAIGGLLMSTQVQAASCKEQIFERYDALKPKVQLVSIQRLMLSESTITYGIHSVIETKAQKVENFEVLTFDSECRVIESKNLPAQN